MKTGDQLTEVWVRDDCSPADAAVEARILDAARAQFAELGYAWTTVHAVAVRADVTAEALGRLFRTKCDLYVAVFDQAEAFLYRHFRAASSSRPTFVHRLEATLDEVARLKDAHPTLIQFLTTVDADLGRSPELQTAQRVHWRSQRAFVEDLVEVGMATGELASVDRLVAVDTITAMLVGLLQVHILFAGAQPVAVEGFKRMITGALLRPGGQRGEGSV